MDCPKCGLINPDTAMRCDCGYDFKTGAMKTSYSQQKLPYWVKGLVVLAITIGVLFVVINFFVALNEGSAINIGLLIYIISYTASIYIIYNQFVKKKKWARIVLCVMLFPIGLSFIISRDVKLYFLQISENKEIDN